MNRYREYSNKALVGAYIFNFPADNPEVREALLRELERRGLAELARQIFLEIYDIFDKKFVEREKEIESEEAREGD